jgi:uncharacterized iron-regulated protein
MSLEPRPPTTLPAVPAPVLDVNNPQSLAELTAQLDDKRVILIGEIHDVLSHHQNQLSIIKSVYARNPKLVIGIEFIQSQFQSDLDDYIAGEIGEREMLTKTEYYKRWRVDYRMLQPIFKFARQNQIPLLALNISSEIHNKVYAEGLDNLNLEERPKVPKNMQVPSEHYQQRLQTIFDAHPKDSSFENFVDGQVLWDEFMGNTAAVYLKDNPDKRMIILTGIGHLLYGDGIPQVLSQRLMPGQSSIIINGDQFGDALGIAHFRLIAPEVETLPNPGRIGVILEETDDGIFIEKFSPNSAAQDADIEIGDQITALGETSVTNMAEIKTVMFDKTPGERMELSIRRLNAAGQAEDFWVELVLR